MKSMWIVIVFCVMVTFTIMAQETNLALFAKALIELSLFGKKTPEYDPEKENDGGKGETVLKKRFSELHKVEQDTKTINPQKENLDLQAINLLFSFCPQSQKQNLQKLLNCEKTELNEYLKVFKDTELNGRKEIAAKYLFNFLAKLLNLQNIQFLLSRSYLYVKSQNLFKGKREYADFKSVVQQQEELDPGDAAYYDYLKEIDEDKQKLVGLYKIHINPKQDKGSEVVYKLLELLSKNEDGICSLVQSFKFAPNFDARLVDGRRFATIVIYPASGKNKVEALAKVLVKHFGHYERAIDKDGKSIITQYNRFLKGPIDYAQGDGDLKQQGIGEKYYTADLALYNDTFLGGKKTADYELKV